MCIYQMNEQQKELSWRLVEWMRLSGREKETPEGLKVFEDLMSFARENRFVAGFSDDKMFLKYIALGTAEITDSIRTSLAGFLLSEGAYLHFQNVTFWNRMCLIEIKQKERNKYKEMLGDKNEYEMFKKIEKALCDRDIYRYDGSTDISIHDVTNKILPNVVELCKSTVYYAANYENYKKHLDCYRAKTLFKMFLDLYATRDVTRTRACTAILMLPLIDEVYRNDKR